ncbi:MAG TPA: site-2 protease family protein [Candidatus Thermoplasmatota archaeon]|nr:site-2 protease family protein [Candidatus Thermoplasmatota archaeon]
MDPWLLATLVFAAYLAVIIILKQTGLLQRANIQAFGPFLVWRTVRFRSALDRLARRRRLWAAFSRVSVVVVFITMGLMVLTLIAQTILLARNPVETLPPQYAIGIPGLNPIIPLGFGVLGLAVAILVHEGCHGILARAEGIKVRSVGLLLVLFPIGAFVEPDESEMRAAPLAKRQRIYAVGPASNILLAVACATLFSAGFMASLAPVDDGVLVVALVPGGPAALAGILPYSLLDAVQADAGPLVDLHSPDDFDAFMAQASPGDNVTVHVLYNGEAMTRRLQLAAREPPVANQSSAVMGIYTDRVGMYNLPVTARPGVGASLCGEKGHGLGSGCFQFVGALYLGMPLRGLSPIPGELAALYTPTGAFASLGGLFWPLADAFYWLFWLNLMVGIFNALPLLPLDGGHMYRDGVLKLLRRFQKAPVAPTTPEEEEALKEASRPHPADELFGGPRRPRDPLERRALSITKYTSLLMLALILLPFVVPPLIRGAGA